MKYAAAALALASAVMAVPVESPVRAFRSSLKARAGITDADILNFALTLEHLEDTFYKTGLSMFSQADFDAAGAVPRLRFNIEEISRDESTHVSFLTSALKAAGATPVAACTYDFGLTDVASFLATSKTLEGVGVSAYLGAAASIVEDAYLTAAGSILTVESRHDAYIRDNQMAPGPQSPFPGPFDIPLDINEVYTLAAPFIKSCPSTNPTLPVKALPGLKLDPSNATYLRAGYTLIVESTPTLTGDVYCAFPAIAGPYFAKATVTGGNKASCLIPVGVPGESYVILTSDNKSITDANTLAGPAILQVQSGYTDGGFPM